VRVSEERGTHSEIYVQLFRVVKYARVVSCRPAVLPATAKPLALAGARSGDEAALASPTQLAAYWSVMCAWMLRRVHGRGEMLYVL
jgi:hypothetical protein